MSLLLIQKTIELMTIVLEILSIIFITYVFFDLVIVDREIELTRLSEKFEKLKRYEKFKNSLIFLVLYLYGIFFSRLALFFEFPEIASSFFSLISIIFLLCFTFNLYKMINRYVSKEEKEVSN